MNFSLWKIALSVMIHTADDGHILWVSYAGQIHSVIYCPQMRTVNAKGPRG